MCSSDPPGANDPHDHPAASEHGDSSGGWLRPAVFGVSDGLVSNAALVLGVAAGGLSGSMVLLTGISGLLAGAFSMAAGEWVSVQAQREAVEREIAREREHHRRFPEQEAAHMREILVGTGLSEELAAVLVKELSRSPEENLGFHTRMELGVDPNQLDSPWVAASSSFVAFGIGALVPLVPYLLPLPGSQVAVSIGLSALATFGVGALLARFTARNPLWSGARQVLIAAMAAGVTMLIGSWLGA